MDLEEAQARLKKTDINQEQLWGLNSLYILLDLHKDEFCKMIDAVGLDVLLVKQGYYERLHMAYNELVRKEKYITAKKRLARLEDEKKELETIVNGYLTGEANEDELW